LYILNKLLKLCIIKGPVIILETESNFADLSSILRLYRFYLVYSSDPVSLFVLIDGQREETHHPLVPYCGLSWASVPFVNSVFILLPAEYSEYSREKGLILEPLTSKVIDQGLKLFSQDPNIPPEMVLTACGPVFSTNMPHPKSSKVHPNLQDPKGRVAFYAKLMKGINEGDISLLLGEGIQRLPDNVLRFLMALNGVKVNRPDDSLLFRSRIANSNESSFFYDWLFYWSDKNPYFLERLQSLANSISYRNPNREK